MPRNFLCCFTARLRALFTSEELPPCCSTEGFVPDFEIEPCGAMRRIKPPVVAPTPVQEEIFNGPDLDSEHAISPNACWLGPCRALSTDIRAIRMADPALHSSLELICYPSLWILFFQRLSHIFYRAQFFFIARLINAFARKHFGADVHPGARIYPGVFIDHALGVVIGESAIVGSGSIIYQGSTIGGTGHAIEGGRRHPIIGEHCVVGSGSKVLGAITVGQGSRVGANAVVLKDVAPGSTMVGIPARAVRGARTAVRTQADMLAHSRLPDIRAAYESRVEALTEAVLVLLKTATCDCPDVEQIRARMALRLELADYSTSRTANSDSASQSDAQVVARAAVQAAMDTLNAADVSDASVANASPALD